MNLHAIAAPIVGVVNPPVAGQIVTSTGYSTDAAGKRTSTYADPVDASFQVQPLSTGDIQRLDALNVQGVNKAVYITGSVEGLHRADKKGGDLLIFDGRTWLVVEVLEGWATAGWTKVAVKEQLP